MEGIGMQFQLKGLDEAMKTFSTRVVNKSINYALNRCAGTIKSQIVKQVADEYDIKQKDIRDKITIGRVEQIGTDNQVKIRIRGSRIPLGRFSVKEVAKGLEARIRKEKPTYYERGFSHQYVTGTKRTKKGKIRLTKEKSAFQRVGAKSYPIWTLYGPSVPQLVGSKWMYGVVQKIFRDRLEKEFIHGINFYAGIIRLKEGQMGLWSPGD